ncbi:MAG: FadR/GntR family transcriptional regulator [Armatimonadota bacterium]|nr:FadR/GntR family transcriptional regulator [Armatimonadota bacterium]MDR7538946.1 FadR/GntR family transcriptional regulator [Armatimonadota bacterium]
MKALAIAPRFQPVRRTRVYEAVAAQIQAQIAEGRLRPGDRLPPERELAQAFGVSRDSVRDAIRVLELAGLVVPRQGEGTVVRELTLDSVVSPLASALLQRRDLLFDLLDARRIIEPALAYRAAQRASEEDIRAMAEILRRQAAKVRVGEPGIDEDTAFHYRLATAARNQVILKVMDVLMDLLREGRARSLQVQGRPQRSLEGHRRILAALRRRDPAGAQRAMEQHLEEIGQILQRLQA